VVIDRRIQGQGTPGQLLSPREALCKFSA
jgi:hypothetical protein